jgi:lauroyl/myristoyl acyltransferase
MELFQARDFREATSYAVAAPYALLNADDRLPEIAQRLAPYVAKLTRPQQSQIAYRRAVLGEADRTAASIHDEAIRNFILERLYLMRCHARSGWEPNMEVIGGQHIKAALDQGRGVIL